ncbi:cell division protein FtsB [Sphaerotilus hippei]|uniref:Cell division protein FtsB n=1 Tax=Sphaerotilus hippei TaxID=744406 RepID=A0A318H0F7_9BURK|nr:septum formation initiator family protein [Sphaerotilus hippei]PXW96224.1 cell division protein FtsB [Sphaerotilus hippei]
MRSVTIILGVLIALVHVELWFGDNGVPRVMELRRLLDEQDSRNAQARTRNDRLLAEVRDLQQGLEMFEERARSQLGMLKPDEILVQYTPPR